MSSFARSFSAGTSGSGSLGAPLDRKKKFALVGGVLTLVGFLVAWSRGSKDDKKPGPSPYYEPEYGAYAYTIRRGDSLTAIAKAEIGKESWALWLYDLNRGTIGPNINLIRAGDVIQIPTAESIGAVPAAIKSDFEKRYVALLRAFKAQCSSASYRGGTGTIDCGKNAIIPVGPDVSDPTVVLAGLGALDGAGGPASSRQLHGLAFLGATETSKSGRTVAVTRKFKLSARAKKL